MLSISEQLNQINSSSSPNPHLDPKLPKSPRQSNPINGLDWFRYLFRYAVQDALYLPRCQRWQSPSGRPLGVRLFRPPYRQGRNSAENRTQIGRTSQMRSSVPRTTELCSLNSRCKPTFPSDPFLLTLEYQS